MLKRSRFLTIALVYLFFYAFPLLAFGVEPPPLQLANIYHQNINLKDYWLSEKLDGVRAYWNGQKFISRQGNIINAPPWFVENFPAIALDGELWIGRNQFELVSGITRQQKPNDGGWQKIRFMVFDLPTSSAIYDQRLKLLTELINSTHSKYLSLIPQTKITNHQELIAQLKNIVNQGGEGLMLHRGGSYYQAARNDDLLKLKPFDDAEAIVIAQIPGKGKYQHMMGALLVENSDKIRFKIGTGFSDSQRKNPPPIGSTITYKYIGKTKNNTPRFASFMRIRLLPGEK